MISMIGMMIYSFFGFIRSYSIIIQVDILGCPSPFFVILLLPQLFLACFVVKYIVMIYMIPFANF